MLCLFGTGIRGIGKSTVAVNLALALARNHQVGLLDADIYGPSLPRMLGAVGQKLTIGKDQKIEPLQRMGLKVMSLGFLVEEDAAVVWRGPMLFKAMDQFLRDVSWGELDYLVVDLPPGTGDVQLSLAQKVPLMGAVMVSTPQNLSLIDVKKAIDMWTRVNVPVVGLIENMAYMINPVDGSRMQLFPKGELSAFLDSRQVQKLGEIPFHPHVALGSEAGVPIVASSPDSVEARSLFDIALKLEKLQKPSEVQVQASP